MNDIKKSEFLNLVAYYLYNHPDWLKDVQMVIQGALEERIEKEVKEKTDLAYAMSVYVNFNPKTTEKYWNQVVNGIKVLFSVFDGSQFGKKISELLNNHKEE